ncbi:unnamed protein product [Blepharisma stoltei]|uniref:Uncharacterized protein n=1 Tax=Blepharisma stoltei TaxID=1481888 RepID=A0AAU9K4E0_9CILI|nr:unnamed protein product [Blepharisma stoltei]
MYYLRSALQYLGLQNTSEKVYNVDETLSKKNDDFIENNHRKLMSLADTLYNFGLVGGGVEKEVFKQKCIELASLFILSLRCYPQTRECDEEMAVLYMLTCLNYNIKDLFDDEFMKRWSEWSFGDFEIMFYRKSAVYTVSRLIRGETPVFLEAELKERNSIDFKTYIDSYGNRFPSDNNLLDIN